MASPELVMPTELTLPADKPDFAAEEEKIEALWKEIRAFERQLEMSAGKPEYVFYDGPPFATGSPHYGHILAGTIKDVVTRYAHQTGHHVPRRFGWDCHGLPIEFEIEKMLAKEMGLKNPDGTDRKSLTKEQVLEYGIPNYNEKCRSIVMRCAGQWREVVSRMGRWIDFDNDYKTMDCNYMESIWWVFKTLFEKDLVYRGQVVLPYSMACSTTLSNFEAQSNYQDVQDPAVTVTLPLTDDPNTCFVAWTTTPWTLPSNLALCVNPDLEYSLLKSKVELKVLSDGGVAGITAGKHVWMMTARICELFTPGDAESYETVKTCKGSELVGISYTPLFDYFKGRKGLDKAWKVLGDSYVTAESGTGIVHQAPAFGADDYRVCIAGGILEKGGDLPCPLDANGCFTQEVGDFVGQNVKDADKGICKALEARGRMAKRTTISHSYPFCWRSNTPLIYRAVPSWFVKVEAIKERLCKNNAEGTYWVPAFVKERRFQNWLEGARDWNIGRTRYWGTPLPIWASPDYKEIVCIGSIEELQTLSGRTDVTDLHRHFVDEITIPSKMGYGDLHRIEETFDCWFESGSMPYAQAHYPFENKERFEATFPADFIAEGLDQTRGWFYTLMVLSTALFDKPAFKNNVVNGLVLAEDGKKMSKSLKNYPDPMAVVNKCGADALRLYLINSPVVRAVELKFKEAGVVAVVKDVFLPWYNAYKFFVTNAIRMPKGWKPDPDSFATTTNIMDKWIIAALQTLVQKVHTEMKAYRLYGVVPPLVEYIELMTNWYVRLNRDRINGKRGEAEQNLALSTLFTVLLTLCKTMSPCTPFITELMYQNLRALAPPEDQLESVHLLMLPEPREDAFNADVERSVEALRTIVGSGRKIRDQHKKAIRVPLLSVTVVHSEQSVLDDLKVVESYLREELNVKEVKLAVDDGSWVVQSAVPNFKVIGKDPELRKHMKNLGPAVKAMTGEQVDAFLAEGTIALEGLPPLTAEHIEVKKGFKAVEGKPSGGDMTEQQLLVLLDLTEDEGLICEGVVREIGSHIQKMRKGAGLKVEDLIEVWYKSTDKKPKGDGLKVLSSAQYGQLLGERLGSSAPCQVKLLPSYAVTLATEAMVIAGSKLEITLTRAAVGFNEKALLEACGGEATFAADLKTLCGSMDYLALKTAAEATLEVNLNDKPVVLTFGQEIFLSTAAGQ